MEIGFLEHGGKSGKDRYVKIIVEGKPTLMLNWDNLDSGSKDVFILLADGEVIESVEEIPYSMRSASFWRDSK